MKGILQHWPAVVFVRHSTSVADVVYRDERDGGHNKNTVLAQQSTKFKRNGLIILLLAISLKKRKEEETLG